MATLSDATNQAIQNALDLKDKADTATNDHNVALANLATAQQAESNTAAAETAAHKSSSDAAIAAIQDMAKDFGVTLPVSSAMKAKR